MLWRLLYLLFEDDVHPARDLLGISNNVHCVRHVAWGAAVKPYYKDSLTALRRVLYEILQFAVRHSAYFPLQPSPRFQNPKLSDFQRMKSVQIKEHPQQSAPMLRAIIVTRRDVDSPNNARKLSIASEDELQVLFRLRGVQAVTCCDYKVREC